MENDEEIESIGFSNSPASPHYKVCRVNSRQIKPYISIRIVQLDHILNVVEQNSTHAITLPNPALPVIRVFGTTPFGQKACAFVYGVAPYLFIKLPDAFCKSISDALGFLLQFQHSLESALDNYSKSQSILLLALVKAENFYGFTGLKEPFVKIFVRDPNTIHKIATLLSSGVILGENFQPYESHIPFHLQFLVDARVSGMDYLHCSKVQFRLPFPQSRPEFPWKNRFSQLYKMEKSWVSQSQMMWISDPDPVDSQVMENSTPNFRFKDSRESFSSPNPKSTPPIIQSVTSCKSEKSHKQKASKSFVRRKLDFSGSSYPVSQESSLGIVKEYNLSDKSNELCDENDENNEKSLEYSSKVRQTYCHLEFDVHIDDILNKKMSELSLSQSSDLKYVPSLASLWEEEHERCIRNGIELWTNDTQDDRCAARSRQESENLFKLQQTLFQNTNPKACVDERENVTCMNDKMIMCNCPFLDRLPNMDITFAQAQMSIVSLQDFEKLQKDLETSEAKEDFGSIADLKESTAHPQIESSLVELTQDDEELVDILRNLSKASSEKLSSTENSAKDKEIGARLEVHTDSNGSMWQFEGEESDNSDGQNIADGVVNDTSTAQSAIEAGISFCELSQRLQGVKVDSNGSQDQILDPQENVHSFLSSSEIVGILQSQMEYEEGLDEATFEKKSRKDGQPQKNTKNNFACTSHTFKECKEENTHIHSCKFADSKQMNKLNLPKTFYNFGKVRYNKRYRWSLFASEEENEFHRSRSRQKVYEMPLHEQIKMWKPTQTIDKNQTRTIQIEQNILKETTWGQSYKSKSGEETSLAFKSQDLASNFKKRIQEFKNNRRYANDHPYFRQVNIELNPVFVKKKLQKVCGTTWGVVREKQQIVDRVGFFFEDFPLQFPPLLTNQCSDSTSHSKTIESNMDTIETRQLCKDDASVIESVISNHHSTSSKELPILDSIPSDTNSSNFTLNPRNGFKIDFDLELTPLHAISSEKNSYLHESNDSEENAVKEQRFPFQPRQGVENILFLSQNSEEVECNEINVHNNAMLSIGECTNNFSALRSTTSVNNNQITEQDKASISLCMQQVNLSESKDFGYHEVLESSFGCGIDENPIRGSCNINQTVINSDISQFSRYKDESRSNDTIDENKRFSLPSIEKQEMKFMHTLWNQKGMKLLLFRSPPPTKEELQESMKANQINKTRSIPIHYSKEVDLNHRPPNNVNSSFFTNKLLRFKPPLTFDELLKQEADEKLIQFTKRPLSHTTENLSWIYPRNKISRWISPARDPPHPIKVCEDLKQKSLDSKTNMCQFTANSNSEKLVPDMNARKSTIFTPNNVYHYDRSQISGTNKSTSPIGSFHPSQRVGFNERVQNDKSPHTNQHLTLMSLELHVQTEGGLHPNPSRDCVLAACFAIRSDDAIEEKTKEGKSHYMGVIMWNPSEVNFSLNMQGVKAGLDHNFSFPLAPNPTSRLVLPSYAKAMGLKNDIKLYIVQSELELFEVLSQLVRAWDIDMLIGYDIDHSWGYAVDRSKEIGYDLAHGLSRIIMPNKSAFDFKPFQSRRTLCIQGRIVLNVWLLCRKEIKLTRYSLENVAFHVLREKIPTFSYQSLTNLYTKKPHTMAFVIQYLLGRSTTVLEILYQLNLIGRSSEMARIFGMDFESVISRGSQFRVESVLLRITRQDNMILVSPSRQQVSDQPAMECTPLVMEPYSDIYTDPVTVFDFQSLYPSIIIAYNMCYSTCLGKISRVCNESNETAEWSIQPKFGVLSNHQPPKGVLNVIVDSAFTSTNGVVFLPQTWHHGALPRMLNEILETRIMVKHAMKVWKDDPILQRILNARQFSLKMLANVTYGYAAAGYSGRMPCAEIADAIVQTGRDILLESLRFIETNEEWNAKVVYGDTDSLFVLFPGRNIQDAFDISQNIACAVSSLFPRPIKLKLEKIYQSCCLLTKKRYAGWKFEKPSQSIGIFDAKGIESIRCDSCLVVQKIMGKMLRIIFETRDLSLVKNYLERQWRKILLGRISLQDFVLSKEVRLGKYSSKVSLPPAAVVATYLNQTSDFQPLYKERVSYIVLYGAPGARLVDLVVSPHELLFQKSNFRLHTTYYITKLINPALDRILNLVNASASTWYNLMKKPTPRSNCTFPISVPFQVEDGLSHYFRTKFSTFEHRENLQLQSHKQDLNVAQANIVLPIVLGNILKQPVFNRIPEFTDQSSVLDLQNVGKRENNVLSNPIPSRPHLSSTTIDQFYQSNQCTLCSRPLSNTSNTYCDACYKDQQSCSAIVLEWSRKTQIKQHQVQRICRTCCKGQDNVASMCESIDCPVQYVKAKFRQEAIIAARNQLGLDW